MASNRSVKAKSYIFSNKVRLNNKHINIKQKAKKRFFKLLQILYLTKQQFYKLEFLAK